MLQLHLKIFQPFKTEPIGLAMQFQNGVTGLAMQFQNEQPDNFETGQADLRNKAMNLPFWSALQNVAAGYEMSQPISNGLAYFKTDCLVHL